MVGDLEVGLHFAVNGRYTNYQDSRTGVMIYTAWNLQHSCYVTLDQILQADTHASSAFRRKMYKSRKQNTDIYTTNMNKPKSPTLKLDKCPIRNTVWEHDRSEHPLNRNKSHLHKRNSTWKVVGQKPPPLLHLQLHGLRAVQTAGRPGGFEMGK